MFKAQRFRRLLRTHRPLILCGAHDALSAKLIEEAGFPAVWASSFGISAASKCLPDANVLTMTEALEAAKSMNESVSIPVIADCDNGYGNALNVMRVVREYERAGIAGISIEDNPFPKKCSLYPGERSELVDRDEMAGRIYAAKSTQRGKDFFVIARTEALIAGLGMEEALSRANAYEEAGADAILIHSRQRTSEEVKVFASRWKGKAPLVAVPTKYPDISAKDLARMGIRMVIFANHPLRACVLAMKRTLQEIRQKGGVGTIQSKIAPLEEVFQLVGQPALERSETRFVKNYTRSPAAVIVAAGFEKNIWPLNFDKPKVMLDIKGKSILERQVGVLRRARIERIAVVTGYKSQRVRAPHIRTYHNPRFLKTHILHSLFCAEAEMQDKFLFLYGDVLFEDHILELLLKSKGDLNLVVQQRPRGGDEYRINGKPQRDWVKLSANGVADIGHHIPPEEAGGEFIGLAFFSKKGARLLREAYHRASRRNGRGRFHNAERFEKAQFTDMIRELILRKEKVHGVLIQSGWLEIDSFSDYQRAWQEVSA